MSAKCTQTTVLHIPLEHYIPSPVFVGSPVCAIKSKILWQITAKKKILICTINEISIDPTSDDSMKHATIVVAFQTELNEIPAS